MDTVYIRLVAIGKNGFTYWCDFDNLCDAVTAEDSAKAILKAGNVEADVHLVYANNGAPVGGE